MQDSDIFNISQNSSPSTSIDRVKYSSRYDKPSELYFNYGLNTKLTKKTSSRKIGEFYLIGSAAKEYLPTPRAFAVNKSQIFII